MTSSNYNRRSLGIDWILLFSYAALVAIGLLMIYTTTHNDYYDRGMWSLSTPFGGQLLWAGISLISLIIISFIDWHIWNSLSLPIYFFGLLLLVLVLIFGAEIKGAKSWILIGSWSLQPSEFVKLSVAIFCSSLLSSIQIRFSEIRSQLFMMGIILLPAFLIVLQPDPGSALTFASLLIVYFRFGMPTYYYLSALSIFLVIVFSLTQGFNLVASVVCLLAVIFTTKYSRKEPFQGFLFLTILLINILLFQFDNSLYALGLDIGFLLIHLFLLNRKGGVFSHFLVLASVAVLFVISSGSSFAFEKVLKPHQQDRINVWLQPEKCDPQGSLYNLLQSKLAIGSGGLSGKGYLNGTLTKLNYVPEQTTDFIFSSIGEEQGFLGSAGVVVLFLILTLRLIRIGESSKYQFIKAYCYCVAGFVFLHFFVNIGMTMGTSPVIGIPLPFISKGGSALLSFSLMIGIALNMSKAK